MGMSSSATKRANITGSGTHRSKLIEHDVTRGDFLLPLMDNQQVPIRPSLDRDRAEMVAKSPHSRPHIPATRLDAQDSQDKNPYKQRTL
jgi:hypothetical protein